MNKKRSSQAYIFYCWHWNWSTIDHEVSREINLRPRHDSNRYKRGSSTQTFYIHYNIDCLHSIAARHSGRFMQRICIHSWQYDSLDMMSAEMKRASNTPKPTDQILIAPQMLRPTSTTPNPYITHRPPIQMPYTIN